MVMPFMTLASSSRHGWPWRLGTWNLWWWLGIPHDLRNTFMWFMCVYIYKYMITMDNPQIGDLETPESLSLEIRVPRLLGSSSMARAGSHLHLFVFIAVSNAGTGRPADKRHAIQGPKHGHTMWAVLSSVNPFRRIWPEGPVGWRKEHHKHHKHIISS